jgi:hypothetical protein
MAPKPKRRKTRSDKGGVNMTEAEMGALIKVVGEHSSSTQSVRVDARYSQALKSLKALPVNAGKAKRVAAVYSKARVNHFFLHVKNGILTKPWKAPVRVPKAGGEKVSTEAQVQRAAKKDAKQAAKAREIAYKDSCKEAAAAKTMLIATRKVAKEEEAVRLVADGKVVVDRSEQIMKDPLGLLSSSIPRREDAEKEALEAYGAQEELLKRMMAEDFVGDKRCQEMAVRVRSLRTDFLSECVSSVISWAEVIREEETSALVAPLNAKAAPSGSKTLIKKELASVEKIEALQKTQCLTQAKMRRALNASRTKGMQFTVSADEKRSAQQEINQLHNAQKEAYSKDTNVVSVGASAEMAVDVPLDTESSASSSSSSSSGSSSSGSSSSSSSATLPSEVPVSTFNAKRVALERELLQLADRRLNKMSEYKRLGEVDTTVSRAYQVTSNSLNGQMAHFIHPAPWVAVDLTADDSEAGDDGEDNEADFEGDENVNGSGIEVDESRLSSSSLALKFLNTKILMPVAVNVCCATKLVNSNSIRAKQKNKVHLPKKEPKPTGESATEE